MKAITKLIIKVKIGRILKAKVILSQFLNQMLRFMFVVIGYPVPLLKLDYENIFMFKIESHGSVKKVVEH